MMHATINSLFFFILFWSYAINRERETSIGKKSGSKCLHVIFTSVYMLTKKMRLLTRLILPRGECRFIRKPQQIAIVRCIAQETNIKIEFNNRPHETIRTVLERHCSQEETQCTIYGWARNVQRQKLKTFIRLEDGSGVPIQVVLTGEQSRPKPPPLGSALACTGRLIASIGRQQKFELACDSLEVIGSNDQHYGTGLATEARQYFHDDHRVDVDYLRKLVQLRSRNRYFQSILRLRSELQNAIAIYMKQEEFIHCTTPLVTTNDCEGGGQTFGLTPAGYFGRPVSLSVSGQLHLEALATGGLGRVYTLSPVFRAERSMSPRHLSEFLMLESEEAFLTHLPHLLDRVEVMIKFFIYYLETNCEKELNYLRKINNNYEDWRPASEKKFVRLDYEQALDMLFSNDNKLDNLRNWRDRSSPLPNINAELERRLVELSGNVPVFVTNYPAEQKPFYMSRSEDGKRALCFDLLMPVCGEVAGGSLREPDAARLEAAMQAQNMEIESLRWYINLRNFGHAPTAGFGLGFDRLLQAISGVPNIKDIVTFPRWPQHCHL